MRILSLALIFAAACGSDSTKTPDAAAGALSCMDYCTTIMGACTGANAQYSAMADCVASCGHFPVGAMADQMGNTLGCRTYHANAAKTDAATHCIHAGPSGGGVCGMPCDGFCSLVTAECATQYPSASGCATTCAGYAATPPYSASVTSGNSLSCRIYHATAASTDPSLHCPHTAMTSVTCM